MFQQILRFMPSAVLRAMSGLIGIWVFSRLLDPVAFGNYSLVWSALLTVMSAVFMPLAIVLTCEWAKMDAAGRLRLLVGTATALSLGAMAILGAVAAVGLAVWLWAAPAGDADPALLLAAAVAVPVLMVRAAADGISAARKAAGCARAYTAAEVTLGAGTVAFGALLAGVAGLGAAGVVLGVGAASLLVVLGNLGWFRRQVGVPQRPLAGSLLRQLAPLCLSYLVGAIIVHWSRYVIALHLGVAQVGGLTIAQNMAEWGMTVVFNAVTLGAFPALLRTQANEGRERVRAGLLHTGGLMMAIGLPSVMGLALIAEPVTAVLVGEAFRGDVARLLPWTAAAAFLGGLARFYFDQIFLLAGRTDWVFYSLLPSAVVTVVGSLILVPQMGAEGAPVAAILAHLAYMATATVFGLRLSTYAFPWRDALRGTLACIPMVAALLVLKAPWNASLGGVLVLMAAAMMVYGLAALAADVAGARQGMRWLLVRVRSPSPALKIGRKVV